MSVAQICTPMTWEEVAPTRIWSPLVRVCGSWCALLPMLLWVLVRVEFGALDDCVE